MAHLKDLEWKKFIEASGNTAVKIELVTVGSALGTNTTGFGGDAEKDKFTSTNKIRAVQVSPAP